MLCSLVFPILFLPVVSSRSGLRMVNTIIVLVGYFTIERSANKGKKDGAKKSLTIVAL
jgi:hypothetical protein